MATLQGDSATIRKALHIALVGAVAVVIVVWGVRVFGRLLSERESESVPVARPNNGSFVEFYPDGSIYSEQHYLHGMRVGTWLTYYPNGALQRVQRFENDREVGRSSYYHSSGKLIYHLVFERGRVVDTVVVDDSLYRYNVVLLDHGRGLFLRTCSHCHSREDAQKLQTAILGWVELVDSLGLDSTAVDSLHLVRIESMIKKAGLNRNELPPIDTSKGRSLDRYDVDAVREYLERVQREAQTPPNRSIRFIRIQPKIVAPDPRRGRKEYENS